ncbi:hypothetical protein ACFQH5_00730 [Halomonas salifodinae]|uniref:Secreted protein n=1 Tax=Halomonas salifodinae TaxID=438745 RepID=A0ABW2EVK3_9GAMM
MVNSVPTPQPSKLSPLPRLSGCLLVMLLLVLLASTTASAHDRLSDQVPAPIATSDGPHCHHGHPQERPTLAALRAHTADAEPVALAPLSQPTAAAPRTRLPRLSSPGQVMAPPPPLYLLTQRFRS